MARNDNLQDLLKDTADAIREKKGTSDLINPQDFPEEIASISGGGGELERLPLPTQISSTITSSNAIEIDTTVPPKDFGSTRVFYKEGDIPTFDEIKNNSVPHIDGNGKIIIDNLNENTIYGMYAMSMNENGRLQTVDTANAKKKTITKIVDNLFDEIDVSSLAISSATIFISKNGLIFLSNNSNAVYRYLGGNQFKQVASGTDYRYFGEVAEGIFIGSLTTGTSEKRGEKYDEDLDIFNVVISGKALTLVFETSRGSFVCAGNYIYKVTGNTLTQFTVPRINTNIIKSNVYETSYGDLIVAQHQNSSYIFVLKYDEDEFRQYPANASSYSYIHEYEDGTVFLAALSSSILYEPDGSVKRITASTSGIKSVAMFENEIYIATLTYIYKFNRANNTFINLKLSTSYNSVASLSTSSGFLKLYSSDSTSQSSSRIYYVNTSNFTLKQLAGVYGISNELPLDNGFLYWSANTESTKMINGIWRYNTSTFTSVKVYTKGYHWKEIYKNGNLHYLFCNIGLIAYDETTNSITELFTIEEEVIETPNYVQVGNNIYIYYTLSSTDVYKFNIDTLQLTMVDNMYGGKNIGNDNRPLLVDNTRHKLYDVKNEQSYDLIGDYTGAVASSNGGKSLSNLPNYVLTAIEQIE